MPRKLENRRDPPGYACLLTSHKTHSRLHRKIHRRSEKARGCTPMSPGEFYEKLTAVLLLHNGWMTSGVRSITHNSDVGGVWDSLHQVALAQDCKLEDKNATIKNTRHITAVQGEIEHENKTMGDLFIRMCDRIGLLAIDEGTHYHVQPKNP